MKTFNNKRKVYSNPSNRRPSFNRTGRDSSFMNGSGNNNNYRRNNKSFKDQYTDYINKALEAKGNGDEVLEQYFLQHAEHCTRQIELTENTTITKKINDTGSLTKEVGRTKIIKKKEALTKEDTTSDFDDLANQLA